MIKLVPLAPSARQKLDAIIAKAKNSPPEQKEYAQFSGNITFNTEQQAAINSVLAGKDTVIIGGAGMGKTTLLKGVISEILKHPEKYNIFPLIDSTHKYLRQHTLGIILTSYTRRAVGNLKKAIPELRDNAVTLHKTLEYAPDIVSIENPETGEIYESMRFLPQRTADYRLDSRIALVILDESGIIPVNLYNELLTALPNHRRVQFVYLGDINQLPPAFGPSVLGIKGNELQENVIELKQVYRQALDSPIIRLAHRILSGKGIPDTEFDSLGENGKLTIRAWKKQLSVPHALNVMTNFIGQCYESGNYNPLTDIILMTQNVNFGTIELNKYIANHFAKKQEKPVHEIFASYNKFYYSIGDVVMYDKQDFVIDDIIPNPAYHSFRRPKPESITMNYHGYDPVSHDPEIDGEALLDIMAEEENGEMKRLAASHIIKLVHRDDKELPTISVSTVADYNKLDLAYCLTVHKSQGSEWKRVFFLVHHTNSHMLSRELLYTAVTRARETLTIGCHPNALINGIRNQKIKGETIAEKFAHILQLSQQRLADS